MVDTPLLRKVVEWVEEQAALPEIDNHWRQGNWVTPPEIRALGLIRMAAAERRDEADRYLTPEELGQVFDVVEEHCGTAYCAAGYVGQLFDSRYAQDPEVDGVHVRDFAKQKLGLSEEQADALFYGGNSVADIRRVATRIAGEEL